MRLMLTGANGQLGWELARSLQPLGEVIALDRTQCDLERPDSLATVVETIRPDVIVNAAAYTAVDKAESEPQRARLVNAEAPGELARLARRHGALLLHYSTDYVFDGSKPGPYVETDPPAPLNVYGASKLEGERAIAAVDGEHLVLRTTWVYAARGANFLRTMLRLGAERETLRVVADQQGAPTWARNLADASALIVAQAQRERRQGSFESGLFHLCAAGHTNWHGFAEAIFAAARARGLPLAVREVAAIATTDYPTPAARPLNSRLDCSRLAGRFGVRLPDWSAALGLCLDDLWVLQGDVR